MIWVYSFFFFLKSEEKLAANLEMSKFIKEKKYPKRQRNEKKKTLNKSAKIIAGFLKKK